MSTNETKFLSLSTNWPSCDSIFLYPNNQQVYRNFCIIDNRSFFISYFAFKTREEGGIKWNVTVSNVE